MALYSGVLLSRGLNLYESEREAAALMAQRARRNFFAHPFKPGLLVKSGPRARAISVTNRGESAR